MFNFLAFFVHPEPTLVYIITGSGEATNEMTATHRGTARVQVGNLTITLKDALYVPKLSTNLISFAAMVKESAILKGVGNFVEIELNGNHHVSVVTGKGIFELHDAHPAQQMALVTTSSSDISPLAKWHARFGHASTARVKTAVGGQLLGGMLTCDVCLKGKMTKSPFQGHFHPTSASLKVFHGDLIGPISPATNGGCQYFLTLVDQHTGFIHVSLLKEKSDATSEIVKYKNLYEKQTGNSIKKLVTDGGGEFCNKVLGAILKRGGIQHNVAPPYTPQHNGLAKRANRTIIKMTRCMMLQSNLAPEWWGKAAKSAAATTNALLSLSKSKSLPCQLFLKLTPRPEFFRPFGCKAWALKPKVKRDHKLDAISSEETLVGDPILPSDDLPTIEDNPPAVESPEEPMEDFPSNPENGCCWIYVPEYTPSNCINSKIDESNI
ncbi:hypothetical protein PCANC_21287, partial [Puccinia coronata f. sp. avenae]